jgi:UPF0755 protein
MRKWITGSIALLLLAGIGVAGLELWAARQMDRPGPHAETVRVHVGPGMTLRAALHRAAERGVLARPRVAEWYLRAHGMRVNVKAGNYDVPARATAREVIDLLASGKVVLEQLTIVEGWTFADLRRAIAAHPRIRKTLEKEGDAAVMAALGHADQHPEGRFFPDTYRFADGTTDREILTLAYDTLGSTLAQAWEQRSPDLPLRTPYEALILASIVEKETALPSERRRIAGVFVTRLRKGMRLQTDPTVIYGIGPTYDGNIRRRDLTTDTPYNTYTRAGLPPTPIALPGRESIFAAVQPEETGEIYFVATGAGDGSHFFSKTLEEHNAAVARYLQRLRSNAQAEKTK